MVRLAALIASYESGAWALACARSVRREWARCGRPSAELEVVIVDDASPSGFSPLLAQAQAEGMRVLRRALRGGYAAAIATALGETRGGPDDVVAVLNADLLFLPGALEPLLAALAREPQLGAVAPRTFADPAAALELPPAELPTPAGELAGMLAALSPDLARRRAARRARRALRAWSAIATYESAMLSGACLLLRRAWIERAGGLLDERFPLYFEDTDLCRRLTAAGARLAVVPAARAVHFWARSTGLGEDFERRAAASFRAGRRLYMTRWHTRAAADALDAGERLLQATPRRDRPFHPGIDLGTLAAPPHLALARSAPYLVEVSLSPTFALAAGALGAGASWRLADTSWEWLHPARYFVRALQPDTLELLGAWSFAKLAPARDDPQALDLEEAARVRARRAA